MAWLVAMHECFFPYVRALVKDRFGPHHSGSQGNGKTTGAELCATLHGLQISANISAAAIRHAGDIGLLVYDNKESDNTTNAQKEDMTYIATGGVSGRISHGTIRASNTHRPVVVLTSIEGLDRKELVSRYIPVEYNAQERSSLNDEGIASG